MVGVHHRKTGKLMIHSNKEGMASFLLPIMIKISVTKFAMAIEVGVIKWGLLVAAFVTSLLIFSSSKRLPSADCGPRRVSCPARNVNAGTQSAGWHCSLFNPQSS